MHDLINFFPGVLCQYSSIRASEIFHFFHQAVDLCDRVIFYNVVKPIECSEEESHLLPSVSTLIDLGVGNGVDGIGSHIFATFPAFTALSLTSMDLDFHYCPCLEDDSTLFTDWMNLQIFNDTVYLIYSLDPPSDRVPSASNCPTRLAYNTLV